MSTVLERLDSVSEELKANPEKLQQVIDNPSEYLAELGIPVDDHAAQSIRQAGIQRKVVTPQASVVHIDV